MDQTHQNPELSGSQHDLSRLPSWRSLMDHLHKTNDVESVMATLVKISDIKREWGTRKLTVLAVVVQEVNPGHHRVHPYNIPITLQDPHGSILACVHTNVIVQFPSILEVGTAVLLKDVTVLLDANWNTGGLIVCVENVVAVIGNPISYAISRLGPEHFEFKKNSAVGVSHSLASPCQSLKRSRSTEGKERNKYFVESSQDRERSSFQREQVEHAPWEEAIQTEYSEREPYNTISCNQAVEQSASIRSDSLQPWDSVLMEEEYL